MHAVISCFNSFAPSQVLLEDGQSHAPKKRTVLMEHLESPHTVAVCKVTRESTTQTRTCLSMTQLS